MGSSMLVTLQGKVPQCTLLLQYPERPQLDYRYKLPLRLNLNEMVQLRILNAVMDAFKPSISHC